MSSGRRTTLEAVNIMLETLGEPHATALDTGGTTIVAEAESCLNEVTNEVEAEGWFTCVTEEYEMKVPLIAIGATGGSGDFLYDEIVEETTTGAQGYFKFIDAELHLVYLSGTFTGGETLTGQSSGATRTGGTLREPTENYLYVNTNWVRVARSIREPVRVAKRGDQLYDETNQAALFSSSVFLDVWRDLYLTDLPFNLASYVAYRAAVRFQRRKKRGRVDDAFATQQMKMFRGHALNENSDLEQVNTLTTAEAKELKGDRTESRMGRYF